MTPIIDNEALPTYIHIYSRPTLLAPRFHPRSKASPKQLYGNSCSFNRLDASWP